MAIQVYPAAHHFGHQSSLILLESCGERSANRREVTRETLEQIAAKFDEKGYSPKEPQTGLRSTARSAILVFNTDLGNSSAPRIHTYVDVVKKGVIMVDREHLRAKTGSDVRHEGESPKVRVDLLRDLRRFSSSVPVSVNDYGRQSS